MEPGLAVIVACIAYVIIFALVSWIKNIFANLKEVRRMINYRTTTLVAFGMLILSFLQNPFSKQTIFCVVLVTLPLAGKVVYDSIKRK